MSRIVFPQVAVGNEMWFKVTHISVSFLVLAIVGVHVGLHWNWVMNMVKKDGRPQLFVPRVRRRAQAGDGRRLGVRYLRDDPDELRPASVQRRFGVRQRLRAGRSRRHGEGIRHGRKRRPGFSAGRGWHDGQRGQPQRRQRRQWR
ncbi:DUF4405 domain-containing protein [Cohnella ginsengisoli]|uniref:DUF4405 domain-containing protein n=1 Tax=Cohnella ginsengisoli TaxID=425004 RepID=A0A9X4KM53_9BACL|nr:DUF4405 domain-containing protein [Cohnella ginsengisoli]MDG0794251.1 DUF4405 domain-containing protein [Cohnella ginsengisoli]